MISSFHAMIPSFHAMISSFHAMISSFHAVFGLRQRDKSAKVIDYNDQVIRVREYLLFLEIHSPTNFLLNRTKKNKGGNAYACQPLFIRTALVM